MENTENKNTENQSTESKKTGRNKPRGKNYTRKVTLVKPANTTIACCEVCGAWPAHERYYTEGHVVCHEHAKPYRASFWAKFSGTAIAILIGALVLVACC